MYLQEMAQMKLRQNQNTGKGLYHQKPYVLSNPKGHYGETNVLLISVVEGADNQTAIAVHSQCI